MKLKVYKVRKVVSGLTYKRVGKRPTYWGPTRELQLC